MSDEQNTSGEKYLVLATFAGEHKAKEVLGILEQGTAQISVFHDEAVVIRVDENGNVSVHGGKKSKKGLVSGTIVGALVGALVGFPVAGILLGGAFGAYRGKSKTKHQIQDEMDSDVQKLILDHMQSDSSLVIAEVDDWQAQNIADSLHSYGAHHVLLGRADEIVAQMKEGGLDEAGVSSLE